MSETLPGNSERDSHISFTIPPGVAEQLGGYLGPAVAMLLKATSFGDSSDNISPRLLHEAGQLSTDAAVEHTGVVTGTIARQQSVHSLNVPPVPGDRYPVTRQTLASWLETMQVLKPETAAAIVTTLSKAIITTFDDLPFATRMKLRMAPSHAATTQSITTMGNQIADDTLRMLGTYTDNPSPLQQFIASDFFAVFANKEPQLEAHRRLLELKERTGYGHDFGSSSFATLLRLLTGALAAETLSVSAISTLKTVTEIAPGFIEPILESLPNTSPNISDLRTGLRAQAVAHVINQGYDPTVRPAHTKALAILETACEKDLQAYTHILEARMRQEGQIDREKARHLYSLLKADPNKQAFPHTARLIAATLPFDELCDSIADQPQLFIPSDARQVAVRRLAQQGRVAEAEQLAYFGHDLFDKFRADLALYDEIGDPKRLAYIRDNIDQRRQSALMSPVQLHELAIRSLVAAQRHSQEARPEGERQEA